MNVQTPDRHVPPVAATHPHRVVTPFGASREDPYYWLRDDSRENPEVIAYLNAENAYADAMLAPVTGTREAIYSEIVARIKPDDASVPYRYKGYWYYSRFVEGQQYPIHARRKDQAGAPEEILLDGNDLAEGNGYFQIGGYEVSPNNRRLAWVEDTVGRRQYTLWVKDLDSGKVHADRIEGIAPMLEWGADDDTLYYIENDPETLLGKRVKRHQLGTPVASDALVYEEADDTFYMAIRRTRSEKYLCIELENTVSNELRCAELADPSHFFVFAPRQRDFLYAADHLDGRWVIRTDWNAPNFRLMTVTDADVGDRARWKEWIAHDEDVFIGNFELFRDFLALEERSEGLRRVRVVPKHGKSFLVDADESAYRMGLAINAEADSKWLRYGYTSLTTPFTTYEIHVGNGERTLLKTEPVLGYDPSRYVTERVWAPARDGTKIPVSIVHRREFKRDGTAALLQYAYGSYGNSLDPGFSVALPSLLDRGMVYAIAHVRGGQEMGRHWYEDGKLLKKINTFTDFIDVTDFLVREGYASADRVAAAGGSAGGLLIGAVANLAPEKYAAMNASVPFVDVVTTMLDTSIPLTTNEYDEWGNPEQPEFYHYMLSYSPYDQVRVQAYPAMYVDTGLWDSQVQYWEPAKWVAKLRSVDTGPRPVLLRTHMEAGHGGKSGRFERYRETAEWYAFLLQQTDSL
ncbi:MAG TPA: S9 family peptidase [Chiayiivirga sp.]|nr:S9 family peptidase [Chiayiivirga sp.]